MQDVLMAAILTSTPRVRLVRGFSLRTHFVLSVGTEIMTKLGKPALLGVLALLALAAAGYLFFGSDPDSRKANIDSPVRESLPTPSVRSDAKVGVTSETRLSAIPNAQRVPTPAGKGSETRSDNPYLNELRTSDRRAAFSRLVALNDPIAAKTAADLAIACHLYGDQTYARTLQRIEAGQQRPDIKAVQRATAERERAKCIGYDSDSFSRATEMSRYVHEKGDPRGVAFNMPLTTAPIPERIAAAQEAARLSDPLALNEVGMFFAARHDVPAGFEFDLGNGTTAQKVIL